MAPLQRGCSTSKRDQRNVQQPSSTQFQRKHSTSEDDPDDPETPPKAKSRSTIKKRNYVQKYNPLWESDHQFKTWVSKSRRGKFLFHCNICDKDYTTVGGRSNLQKHAISEKHVFNAKAIKKQPILDLSVYIKKNELARQIKEAEVKMVMFIVEHNISFITMDHLSLLIKSMCPDSAIAKNINCCRTKYTKLIQNVTGKYSSEKLVTLLQSNNFSLIVDESTDISAIKHLAMVVRLFVDDHIVDAFLALIPVPSVTAQSLYNVVVTFFNDHDIPYKNNLIGFAAYGASNMFGIHQSLSVLLKKDVPNLFLMKCICHSFALCANYACEKLPRVIEDIARDVYNYVQHSYKRQMDLQEFQNFVDVKPQKLLHPSQTRWLSLLQVVKRLVKQYNALVLYFTNAVLVDKVLDEEMILTRLREKYVLMYLHFLEFVLPFFNGLNLEMQSEETNVHLLYSKVSGVYKSLPDCFLKPDYLHKMELENINPENPHNFLPIEEIYLGAKITATISNDSHGLTSAELLDLRKRCLQFYIESCKQIVQRFNFKDLSIKIIKQLSVIDPEQIQKHASIAPLASRFPNLVQDKYLNEIDAEWRELRNLKIDFEWQSDIEFWVQISKIKLGDDTLKFKKVSDFMIAVYCLPHSSATVERLFSQINLNKTSRRNRLGTDSLTGVLHTKALLRVNNCYDAPISNDLLAKFNDLMYDKKK